nr:receptor-like protein EIX2 [Coffea arabica]
MTYLNLSGNFMNGEIPFSMGKMKYLTELYLSNNKFSGEIHDNWGNSQALLIIDLSMNNLSGNLPSSMFLPTYILWLKLNGNNLSGELPFGTTINSTYLSLLDLGDNRFSGKIPRWIGERLTSLTVLRLRNNKFIGSIPQELCSLQMLHVLDFADNDLSGHLPICLGNLSGFHDVMLYHKVPPDVPYAFIPQVELVVKGREMAYTKTLKLVNIIDLSSNHLQGDIPEEKPVHREDTEKDWQFRPVGNFDLSWNSLSGSIPPAMSHMTSLNFLNLSHNNLSGPIPSTNQFLTFQDPSIYGGAFSRVEMLLRPAFTAVIIADQQSLVFALTLDTALKCTAPLWNKVLS